MPLMGAKIDHPQSRALEAIRKIIRNRPIMCEHIMQDLNKNLVSHQDK